MTQGFNPHLKISIQKALKLGIESDQEQVLFYLKEAIPPERFKERFNDMLPKGIQILDIEEEKS